MSGPPVLPGEPASSNSTTALILGIIGVVGSMGSCCCCLAVVPGACAPVAWYMGRLELAAIRAGRSPAAGEGSAQAGMILGMVGSALLLLYIVGMLAYVALVGGAVALETLKKGGLPATP
jgi:hypothetical protein